MSEELKPADKAFADTPPANEQLPVEKTFVQPTDEVSGEKEADVNADNPQGQKESEK